jgi:hypothetical protein
MRTTLTSKRRIKRCSWPEVGKVMKKTEYAL